MELTAQGIIPPAVAARLAAPVVEGTRHIEALGIAGGLCVSGLPGSAIFHTLRVKYPQDMTDKELWDIVSYVEKAPKRSPDAPKFERKAPSQPSSPNGKVQPTLIPERKPEEQMAWWLSGLEMTTQELTEKSPIIIPESDKEAAVLFVEMLYAENDHLNIVCKFTMDGEKANPSGAGKTMLRNDWVEYFHKNGVPRSEAGAWFRMNPCKEIGSGKMGAITDEDVTVHRFILLESDKLPVAQQLAFFSKIKLPVAAVLSSGGKSVHAWIRVDAIDAEQYKSISNRIIESLKPFGMDGANKNSSRLSRLPGAIRKIQSHNGGIQRLIYLDAKNRSVDEGALIAFEESLKQPALEEKPFLKPIREAANRYAELYGNRGKLGVMTGITEIDSQSGGLKPGNFIVLSAETGGGKSTLALNIINTNLKEGNGVLLFSLEMDRDEIFDALVSLNCEVNRDVFNTGYFSELDREKIVNGTRKMSDYKLWIEDSAVITVEDIRKKTLHLKSENKIKLVVVDYIQILSISEYKDNREQQIASAARALRCLAKEAKIPIIILSQLNEEGKLRESRVIGHEANMVLKLEDMDTNPALRVMKGRRIRRGKYDVVADLKYYKIQSPPKIDSSSYPTAKAPHND